MSSYEHGGEAWGSVKEAVSGVAEQLVASRRFCSVTLLKDCQKMRVSGVVI
jgi:hypothetical protein